MISTVKLDYFDEKITKYVTKILPGYLLVIVLAFVVTLVSAPLLRINAHLIHTLMDLFYIFIAVSSFLIIWHSFVEVKSLFTHLGFGLLGISIFYFMHMYLTLANALGLTLQSHSLSIAFYTAAGLAEALIFYAISLDLREIFAERWKKVIAVLIFSFTFTFLLSNYWVYILHFMNSTGIILPKGTFEYVIIFISLLSLHNLKFKLTGENEFTYRYIFIALMLKIPSELAFINNDGVAGFFSVFSHILKVTYYYCLYKAVYVSTIQYPYIKLGEAYQEQEKYNGRIREISSTLNETLDAIPIGILKYGKDTRVEYMNKSLEDMISCDRHDLYGKSIKELAGILKLQSEKESILLYDEKAENAPAGRIVVVTNQKTGKKVSLLIYLNKIGNGVLVFADDAKKQQEIKNFNLQTKTILNTISNAIFIVDMDEKIIMYNETFNKLFELDGQDITGMKILDFNARVEYKGEYLFDIISQNIDKGHSDDINILSFKGNRLELLNHMTPIVNVEGEIIGAVVLLTDITGIKLQQHSIEQQEKLALIGQMAAGIVHEIKNPLSTIKGLSQLIKMKAQEEKVREYSSVIDSAIDDVTNVVNEFLSFARPKPSVVTSTYVNKIVESMHLITETQCYTKNIRNRFHYWPWPIEIQADENKIKQVILNLTENAIFALQNVEDPELSISTYYDPEAKEAIIEVKDNGIGMDPYVLSKLGTPFFTTKEKGTGLGLGISYEIMREHNGRIDVVSEVGRGTVFRIVFMEIEHMN